MGVFGCVLCFACLPGSGQECIRPFVADAFGKPVVVTAEFVAKSKSYYDQNIVREPFSLKVFSVNGRVLKEAVIIRYFLEADKKKERKLERAGLVQEFEAYETIRQPISATPWLRKWEQGTGFYLEHLLHIRAVNEKK
ncbi:MAG: hypothetical protein D3920_12755 [Candidatus Electrothrix sp. AW2]|nr:hypothetical protein [Candidatus Electrothrix gigas]